MVLSKENESAWPQPPDDKARPSGREDTGAAPRAVEVRELGRRFGRHWALAHVHLDVQAGEVLLVAGANGSGKTTLVRTVAGLYRPTTGHLRIFGKDPRAEPLACRRLVSLVSHDTYLYHQLTALETVRIWARLLGLASGDRDLIARLQEVGLAGRRNVRVGGFSAGMRKRLTLLRVQLEKPRIVLLDEPFAALDADGQHLVEGWVRDFHAQGATVIMASHALERAARLCSRGLLLTQGQIAWQGSPEELPQRVEAGT